MTSVGSSSIDVNAIVSAGQLDLDVAGTGSSLEAVRDAINKSPQNPGVSASIIFRTDGAHLSLTSCDTGTANAFSPEVTAGDGGLDGLAFNRATGRPVPPAADAEFTIRHTD